MCGITGFFNDPDAVQHTLASLSTLKHRGKDGYGICNENRLVNGNSLNALHINSAENAIGHCLHSIVGNIKQPMKGNGSLVINGEIYNWKALQKKHKVKCKNDSELVLKLLDKQSVKKTLGELNGVFALAYWRENTVTLARDVLGEKPLWYSVENGLAFASEKKALEKQGLLHVRELNPRTILSYNTQTKKPHILGQTFFAIPKQSTKKYEQLQKEFSQLLEQSIADRTPNKKIGILFSGGVDSTLLAMLCKKAGIPFTCYLGAVEEKGARVSSDLENAKNVAQAIGVKVKVNSIPLSKVESYLKKIIPIIEDNTVVKAGVSIPFYLACEQAKKDGVKVMFSGSGADELFAGYQRFDVSQPISQETLSLLRRLYEKDLYRDDSITMHNTIELRLPYLDKELIRFALKLPPKYKLSASRRKIIVRDTALKEGLEKQFAERKKTAAQYGSNADWAIEKLARRKRFKTKSAFLKTFNEKHNLQLGALISGGKDGLLAMEIMKKQNQDIACLITIESGNPDSFMFHTPNTHVVEGQAKSMGIPLIKQKTQGVEKVELKDLETAIKKAIKKHHIEGIVSGALYSNYQRTRIENIADTLGLKVFAPLWHVDQEQEMIQLLNSGYEIVFSSVAAAGLSKEWVGKALTHDRLKKLVALNKKVGLNIAGEGGEFESLVLDAPLFNQKIKITQSSVESTNPHTARLTVNAYKLAKK
jgi:diphthine-ammonia ligase